MSLSNLAARNLHPWVVFHSGELTRRDMLAITGVVLGPLCEVTSDGGRYALPTGVAVMLCRSLLAFRSFRVIRNKAFRVEHVRGA